MIDYTEIKPTPREALVPLSADELKTILGRFGVSVDGYSGIRPGGGLTAGQVLELRERLQQAYVNMTTRRGDPVEPPFGATR